MTLKEFLKRGPYQGYSYSYPHKSTYRLIEEDLSLKTVWEQERQASMFLYLHIPFCEMRCGFCNLFTMANPKNGLENPYLPALKRQVEAMKTALNDKAKFARLAIGGGTPSFLSENDLEKMFMLIHQDLGVKQQRIPASMEVSPKTVNEDKLALMFQNGINRVSIGIQSFIEEETKLLGRPQKAVEIKRALDNIRKLNFETLSIDLIYGGASQTSASWKYSLEQCMNWNPEEVFLYPLYVRPLTGLDRRTDQQWTDFRFQLYQEGRHFLLTNNYEQVTMRIFRRKDAPTAEGPAYNSPEDGMVGIGVGARSYTKDLHYSSEYAVGRKGVKNIIGDFNEMSVEAFKQVNYGTKLNAEEQRRRYVIKSLLEGENLNLKAYSAYFGSNVYTDLPQLTELLDDNMAVESSDFLVLSANGLAYSDAIGPWLYSSYTNQMMQKFELV